MTSQGASVPSKVFVLGEYAALAGLPALLLATPPRFSVEFAKKESLLSQLHPQSPAGRWLEHLGSESKPVKQVLKQWSFEDPHLGAGGFGASTAQFILLGQILLDHGLINRWDTSMAWSCYRQFSTVGKSSPSGADLVIQMEGGISWVSRSSEAQIEWRPVKQLLSQFHFLLFSAVGQDGRKVPTHHHLSEKQFDWIHDLHSSQCERLNSVLARANENLVRGDSVGFGECLVRYAESLSEFGLECEASRLDRQAFLSIPGVLGAKGCGAMLSDVLLVLIERGSAPVSSVVKRVMEVAAHRGLKLVQEQVSFISEGLKRGGG